MNDSSNWRDLVVSFDEAGLEQLRRGAGAAVNSLATTPAGPRSRLSPHEIHELIATLDVCPDEGVALDAVLEELGTKVWAHGVVPSDPACVAHLHPPSLLPAVVSELAIAAANQSMDSWDQSPAATEVELHLLGWLAKLIGLPAGASGVMTSGGTASNVLAMTLARSAAAQRLGVDVLKSGLPPEAARWRVLCSDQAHFSLQRAAQQLGLGRDAVVTVATTAAGQMDLAALDTTLEGLTTEGLEVIALVATAGTTDLGVIDPMVEIAARAQRHDAWFHVDAAVAGAFLLSERLRPLLAGLELADSVTVDFHKLWWQPFNASALIVADVARFDLLRVRSDYLDRGDELDGVVNLVGRSLDTSRRFDALKVVTSLRTLGRRNLAAMLEQLVALTNYAAARVEESPHLALVAAPATVSCVFDAPGFDADALRDVQQRLLLRGEMVLGRTKIKGRAALKFTFMNPLTTTDDVDQLIALITDELAASGASRRS